MSATDNFCYNCLFDIRKLFEDVDKNKSGQISRNELIKQAGRPPFTSYTADGLNSLFFDMNKDRCNFLCWNEWLDYHQEKYSSTSSMHTECIICHVKDHFHNLKALSQNTEVNQIIDLLRKIKIKLIAFDFDNTLVSIHTHGHWRGSAEKLAKHVRPFFLQLIAELLKCSDIFFCIVSYSPQEELIREVLKISLSDYNVINKINKVVIKGNTKEFVEMYGINNLYANGKQIHLDYARWNFESENNKILSKNVLLVDDDLRNLQLANQNGHFTFQVTSSTQLSDFLNYLKNLK